MTNHATRGSRTRGTSPYLIDDLVVTFHRSAAGLAWRWRTELIALALTTAALLRLRHDLGDWIWPGVLTSTMVLGLLAVPATRRYITRRFWCVLARHRIQRLCWEARLHTRAGRLPLILWTRPTKVGERAWLLCRAGICSEDFENHIHPPPRHPRRRAASALTAAGPAYPAPAGHHPPGTRDGRNRPRVTHHVP